MSQKGRESIVKYIYLAFLLKKEMTLPKPDASKA
jgi:hypothetical protein